jgi:hypothetical protein
MNWYGSCQLVFTDGVKEITAIPFHWDNKHTITWIINILSWGGKGRPARKADNLTAICEPIV